MSNSVQSTLSWCCKIS